MKRVERVSERLSIYKQKIQSVLFGGVYLWINSKCFRLYLK